MRRIFLQFTFVTIIAALLAPAIAEAQVRRVSRGDSRHSIGLGIGYFSVRGEDSRVENDVLLADLDDLAFDVDDFNGALFDGEWLFGVSDYLEAGLGLGYYQRTVPSVYARLQHESGAEIEQELKLRVIPFTATVRFLPIGRAAAVQPYVGVGLGLNRWRYSETGEFVNEFNEIFRARFADDGTAAGPVILAGLRAPVGDVWNVGGEIRWQRANGDLDPDTFDWLPDGKIDLGGVTASFKVHLRF